MKRVCVFCGASKGLHPAFHATATDLGTAIVKAGLELVFGGGRVGLMGAVADAVLAAGGKAIGVIPRSLVEHELAHKGTELRIVQTMHERKALMAELSDGFIALPGGVGTLDEFFEIWTWAQLGIHRKPCALLNVNGYFDLLIEFLDRSAVTSGFIERKSRDIVMVDTTSESLLGRMQSFQSPDITRFMTLKDS